MPSLEKFRETLDGYGVDEGIILKIYKGFEIITSKSSKKMKAEFFAQALRVMENELGQAKTQEIFRANGCCKTGARLKKSKEFTRINEGLSSEEKLAKIRKAQYINMGSPELLENGDILVNAVSYVLDGKYACGCPTISRQALQPKDKNYCSCCSGHFQFHYEIMLGCKLQVAEVVSSPLDSEGENPCVFRLRIVGE